MTCILAFTLLTSLALAADQSTNQREGLAPSHDGYIVRLRPGGNECDIPGSRLLSPRIGDYRVIPNEALGTLDASRIEEMYPNVWCKASGTKPDDPLFPIQKHLHRANVVDLWRVVPDADGILVAVLDTGVAYENWSDSTGTYYLVSDLSGTAFKQGYDFVNGDDHANDDNHHGTFMAAVVAETTNNDLGGAAIAPGAAILPVKVLDASGAGTLANVISGIVFAADAGADVILMSFAFPSGLDPGPLLDQALEYAHQRGAVMVAAAGNDGKPDVSYPAASPYCVAVGAARTIRESTGSNRTGYSNWGTAIDLIAFGGDGADRDDNKVPDAPLAQTIAAGDPATERYYLLAGTSSAAASVAGTIALLRATGATPAEAIDDVLLTAKDLESPGFDTATGYGLLDAVAAAQRAVKRVPSTSNGVTATIKLSLEFAGSQKARLIAKIHAHFDDGTPAGKVRAYAHFRGAFAAFSGDDVTSPQGKAEIKTPWLDISGINVGKWIPGQDYNITVDRVVSSPNPYSPKSLAPIDYDPGTDVVIDTPIKDR